MRFVERADVILEDIHKIYIFVNLMDRGRIRKVLERGSTMRFPVKDLNAKFKHKRY